MIIFYDIFKFFIFLASLLPFEKLDGVQMTELKESLQEQGSSSDNSSDSSEENKLDNVKKRGKVANNKLQKILKSLYDKKEELNKIKTDTYSPKDGSDIELEDIDSGENILAKKDNVYEKKDEVLEDQVLEFENRLQDNRARIKSIFTGKCKCMGKSCRFKLKVEDEDRTIGFEVDERERLLRYNGIKFNIGQIVGYEIDDENYIYAQIRDIVDFEVKKRARSGLKNQPKTIKKKFYDLVINIDDKNVVLKSKVPEDKIYELI